MSLTEPPAPPPQRTSDPTPPELRVLCACGQMLARRWPGGGVEPVVMGAVLTADNRLSIQCPACKRRARLRSGKGG
jgi:hypothetical protein